MIFTTIEDKRIQQTYKQKSLKVKWKLNTNSIFNLKSFVTAAILETVKVLRQRPSQVSITAFMYKVLQYEWNCKFNYRLFKQETRRLIGSFHLKQKPIYFSNCKTANPFIFKFGYYLSLTNNLMKYIFVIKYN